MPDTTKANVNKIFGTALFSVVSDLVTAKESGQKLPGLLNDVANIAMNAKDAGIDVAKEEAKSQVIKYIPWVVAGVLLFVLTIILLKKKGV